jgi:predicted ferric reductase
MNHSASPPAPGPSRRPVRGLHPGLLVALYLALAVAPLGLAAAQGLSPRPVRDELATGLALVGFAMLPMEFLLSGRFRTITGRMGIDLTMRFHQLVARTLTVFVLVHPFLYTTPLQAPRPWDPTHRLSLGLDTASILTGIVAWILLALLVFTSLFRAQLPYRYETWRVAHGFGALLVAGFGLHHALAAGRYSADPLLGGFWIALFALAALTLLSVYVVRPWRLSRAPYRVAALREAAARTWALDVQPADGEAMDFRAGQFAWVTLGRSPFSVTEHPFSISSCPADRPRIEFTIKEAGDFTDQIGRLPIGSRAYLDGPYGHVTLPEADDGLVLIAGGVGFAPVVSMLRQMRADRDQRPVLLIYGNRKAAQILYAEEIEAMRRELNLTVHHVLAEPPPDWTGATGQLDARVLEPLLSFPDREARLYYVCGPAPMIRSVETALGELGIPVRRILSEKFSYD